MAAKKAAKSAAWTRKEGKNPEGGLNAKGRASYKAETGGTLKPPVSAKQAKKSPKAAARRDSFCARMEGMKAKNTSSKTANDPNSRINKALRKWDCQWLANQTQTDCLTTEKMQITQLDGVTTKAMTTFGNA